MNDIINNIITKKKYTFKDNILADEIGRTLSFKLKRGILKYNGNIYLLEDSNRLLHSDGVKVCFINDILNKN